MNEKELIKTLLSDFKSFSKPLQQVNGISPTKPEAIEELEKALGNLPSPDAITQYITEFKLNAASIIAETKQAWEVAFTKILSEYLRAIQAAGTETRETSSGWRVGLLELEMIKDKAMARFCYNREPLTLWKSVKSVDDLILEEAKAAKLLTSYEIADNDLTDVCFKAFNHAKKQNSQVLLAEFYKELRIELFRKELAKGSSTEVKKYTKFPKVAFLFNMDRYRSLAASLTPEQRLGFQTGSQHEVSQGKGYVLNGLDPQAQYKVMCYIIKAGV